MDHLPTFSSADVGVMFSKADSKLVGRPQVREWTKPPTDVLK